MIHVHGLRRITVSQVIGYLAQIIFGFSITSALYRHYIRDAQDPYKCRALQNHGTWLDAPSASATATTFHKWQPPGCMIHEYRKADIQSCLQDRQAVFIGDSTIRQIFWAFAAKLDSQKAVEQGSSGAQHSNLGFSYGGVDLSFVWDPYLNDSSTHSLLNGYRRRSSNGPLKLNSSPALLVIGGGLWYAKNLDLVNATLSFDRAIQGILSDLHTKDGPTNHPGNPGFEDDLTMFTPVQKVLYSNLKLDKRITSAKVDHMNDLLSRATLRTEVPVAWSLNEVTWQTEEGYLWDGIHDVNGIVDRKADIMLNLRCNAPFMRDRVYPKARSCCATYAKPERVQRAFIKVGLLWFPVIFWISAQNARRLPWLPSEKIARAFVTLTATLCYCYFADRTQLFEKKAKNFELRQFVGMCMTTTVLGMLTTKRSKLVKPKPDNPYSKPVDQPFLAREQTDEWKGWMQFFILIYHYTGASQTLSIYKGIRLCVASYLFMTGFGHTVYFLRRKDFSLRRHASVLVRLNLLSCCLSFVMGTDYLFYYFAPLTSFWYVIVALTLWLRSPLNQFLRFLFLKIILAACLVSTLVHTPAVLETIFLGLRKSCAIEWDLVEWRFRVRLDGYIVFVGMIAASVFVRFSSEELLSLSALSKYGLARKHLIRSQYLVMAISWCALPLYWLATSRNATKQAYNRWVPYTSWVPILSFTILRNSNQRLRNIHSSLFAWLGRCSLETFTLQFHIWLAADTKGILELGIFRTLVPNTIAIWLDSLCISTVFLWLSWLVADATNTLTVWIIDPKAGRPEVEIDAEVENKLLLPKHKSKERLSIDLKIPLHRGVIEPHLITPATNAIFVIRHDLRARLALLVTILWFLNMIY